MMWTVSGITSGHDARIVTLEREDQTLSGRWSTNVIPLLGTMTYAEIDIGMQMDNINYEEAADFQSHSLLLGSNNIMIGLIESIDDDLMHFFRISIDCLIMIESHRVKLSINKFYKLVIPTNCITIHPC